MIDTSRLSVDEIAGIKRPVVHLQYSVEKVQFFDPGMRVAGIVRIRIQSHQHAHAFVVRVARENLDVDAGCRLFPLRRRQGDGDSG